MKTEDFERLKKLCYENGFELVTESPKDNDKFFVVKKKDEWEGVEFVEHTASGKIFKPMSIRSFIIDLNEEIGFKKTDCKPSTEQAYIEQLKKEAFERFGEIKDGDEFVEADGNKWITKRGFKKCGNSEWHYIKENDILFNYALVIYQKGKWAERVKERVKIKELHITSISKNWGQITFKLSQDIDLDLKCGDFISQQLEKYLNNEI